MNVTLQEFLDVLWHFDKPIVVIKAKYLEAVSDEVNKGANFDTTADYGEFALYFKYVSMQTKFYLQKRWFEGKVIAFNVFDEGMMVFIEEYTDGNNSEYRIDVEDEIND